MAADDYTMGDLAQLAPGLPDAYANDPLTAWSDLGRGAWNAAKGMGNLALIPGQAYQSTPDNPVTTEQLIKPAADMAGMISLGSGAVPATANEMRMGIKAYHGSPYDFEKFDISKIGTGEGAQAYGHGLYFAENENVARQYKKNLAPASADIAPSWKGDGWQVTTRDGQNVGREFFPTREEAEAFAAPFNKGKMYEVNINAEPGQFLNWDKPIWQQGVVASKLQELYPDLQGETVQRAFPYGIRPAISAALEKEGIPGIRYLDQGSRNVQGGRIEPTKHGTFALYDSDNAKFNEFANRADAEAALRGSSNYVVFNPEIVDILKKYGLAGMLGTGAMGGLAAQDQYAP